MRLGVVAVVLAVWLGAAQAGWGDDQADCLQDVDLDLAIRACTAVLAQPPAPATDLWGAHAYLGWAYKQKGMSAEALAQFDMAIALFPDGAIAYRFRGQTLGQMGLGALALADLDRAIALEPQDAHARYYRGVALLDLDRKGPALESFDSAIRLSRSPNWLYFLKRGRLHMHLGQAELALADADSGLAVAPGKADLLSLRARAEEGLSDFELALQDADRAVAASGASHPIGRPGRGRVRFYLGDYAAALPDLADWAALNDGYGALWQWLAVRRSGGADADAALAKEVLNLGGTAWPYPLMQAYLGRITPEAALAAAADADQRCEAQFYLGALAATEGDVARARPMLQTATATCPANFMEYSAAPAELARLAP